MYGATILSVEYEWRHRLSVGEEEMKLSKWRLVNSTEGSCEKRNYCIGDILYEHLNFYRTLSSFNSIEFVF